MMKYIDLWFKKLNRNEFGWSEIGKSAMQIDNSSRETQGP